MIILYFVYLQSMRPKTYWHTISNLFTSPKYYLEILKAPFWFSFRFFIISMIILGLAWTLKVNQIIVPAFQQEINNNLDKIEVNYPAELEISWQDNQLESSINEIIEIPYPDSFKQNSQFPPIFGYFIPENISSEQFSTKFDQKSLLVLTNSKFFINNLQGDWANIPLSEVFPKESIILNKGTASELISKLKDELEKIFYLVKQLNFVVIPLAIIIIKLWMSFLEAILIFLFFKLNRVVLNFKKTLQLSLHLVVVAEVIAQITSWIYPSIQFSMFTLSYWSIFGYIFWTQKKRFSKFKT